MYAIRSYYGISLVIIASLSFTNCANQNSKKSDTQAENKKPNIVFFIADDMYPDMFNCLPEGEGQNYTPNIDRLVAEGTVMTNQYVNSPVCTPSRYNCLTGRFASRATNKNS